MSHQDASNSDQTGAATSADGELIIAANIHASLDALHKELAGMHHLVAKLSALPLRIRTQQWQKPGPPKPTIWTALPTAPPGLTPVDVLARWKAQGPRWIELASRRELRAAVVALMTEPTAQVLSHDPRFLDGLMARLRGRQLVSVVGSATFAHYPTLPHVIAAARRVDSASGLPAWWTSSGWPEINSEALARWLGEAVIRGELVRPGDLDVPEIAWTGGWTVPAIGKVQPRSLEQVRRQIVFAHGGKNSQDAAMTPAAASAIRAGVKLAKRASRLRRDMAIIARQRVGSPFGADAEARWRMVAEELPRVRSWLAGEVLAIVFEHLTPPNSDVAYMTRPRKVFWSHYTGSVRRMWVAVTRSIRPQLNHPDLHKLKAAMGEDLVLCDLEGGPDQAIVWMHLQGPRGVVTAIEGNANTSVRVREGEYRPRHSRVEYRFDIVHGEFRRGQAFTQVHRGQWQWKVASELAKLGIRKDDS